MKKVARSEFDLHLEGLLRKNPKLAREYAIQFAELPLPTQLAIMRRRKWLSQKSLAKKLRVKQPHVARTESPAHDSRLSSLVSQVRALHCHLMVIPDELLSKVTQVVTAKSGEASRHLSK